MLFVLAILLMPLSLFAYLDPGSGAVLVNLIIAGAAALLYGLKGMVFRLLGKKNMDSADSINAEIAIFSEGKQYWATFEPLIKALSEKGIHHAYHTLDIDDPALKTEYRFCDARFLGYSTLGFFRASHIKARILISTTPNIGYQNYPVKRSPKVQELVHIFHSIADLAMYRIGSLDFYDSVYMVGDFQVRSIREIEAKRQLKPKKLISLGLPYLDTFITEKKGMALENPGKVILIASSWGDKGILKRYGTGFIGNILASGWEVIVRPHPQSRISEPVLFEQWKKDLSALPRVTWDDSISPVWAMQQAQILISDTSSIRFDFAFIYEKPVITIDIPASAMPGFEREYLSEDWSVAAGAEIGYVLDFDAVENDLVTHIQKTIADFPLQRLRAVKARLVLNFGSAGKAIAEHLGQEIRQDVGQQQ